jgi:hypothetical protein
MWVLYVNASEQWWKWNQSFCTPCWQNHFPTSCKQWVEVSLTKEKCWDQWEQIFASSVFWLFSDGGLKKTNDLLEHNVHVDGIHMWCCNANGSDSPLFGILVILTDFSDVFQLTVLFSVIRGGDPPEWSNEGLGNVWNVSRGTLWHCSLWKYFHLQEETVNDYLTMNYKHMMLQCWNKENKEKEIGFWQPLICGSGNFDSSKHQSIFRILIGMQMHCRNLVCENGMEAMGLGFAGIKGGK